MNKRKRTQESSAQEVTERNCGEHSMAGETKLSEDSIQSPSEASAAGMPEGEEISSSNGAVQQALETLQQELEATQDQLLRTAAEFDNFRKRTIREKEALSGEAFADAIIRWLPLVDNLDRGVLAAEARVEEAGKEILEGLQLIQRQAHEILTALSVEEIAALGETFDPNLHHAVLSIEDETHGEQEIVEVFEKGYRRGDRILRHAVVKVAN